MAPDEIALGDTIGVAVPRQVTEVLTQLAVHFDMRRTALHFHNTYGMALAAAQAGYAFGVRKFDGASGGIGGCPYAKGATGNAATEELLYAFFRQGSAPAFPREAIRALLSALRDRGLEVRSHLAEIQAKNGQWYGV
jgi:hydroxymethylglutaryl-CoA lyase